MYLFSEDAPSTYSDQMAKINANGYLTTATDLCANVIGGGPEQHTVAATINRSTILSDKMSSLFAGTKVNVYVYNSKVPNAFTLGGNPNMMSPIAMRILSFAESKIANRIGLGIILFPWLLMIALDKISNLNKIKQSGMINDKIVYNPHTRKIELSVPEITCYISSSMIAMLNDDEVVAILLHECGHNMQIMQELIFRIVNNVLFIGIPLTTLAGLYDTVQATQSLPTNTMKLLLCALCVLLLAKVINQYFLRRIEYRADEFAFRCGYGKEMTSALRKLEEFTYLNPLGGNKIKGFNIVDKLIHLIQTPIMWLNRPMQMMFGGHPDIAFRQSRLSKLSANTPNLPNDRSDLSKELG